VRCIIDIIDIASSSIIDHRIVFKQEARVSNCTASGHDMRVDTDQTSNQPIC
jgi:hypothetical protein